MNRYLVGERFRDLIPECPFATWTSRSRETPRGSSGNWKRAGRKSLAKRGVSQRELILAGRVEASISAAREDFYAHPGSKMCRCVFQTIMGGLETPGFFHQCDRNFPECKLSAACCSIPPTGLADLERREIRALSIRSFTNQPYAAFARAALRGAYGFQDGFAHGGVVQAWARNANCKRPSLRKTPPTNCGNRRARKKPAAVLKAWESAVIERQR